MPGSSHKGKRLLLPLGLAGLLLAACTKEYVSPIPYERVQILFRPQVKWTVTGRVSTYNGVTYDLYATGDTCRKDNFRMLKLDSTLLWLDNGLKCTPLEPDTVEGHWTLSEDYQTLYLQNDPDLGRPSYQIRRLDDSTMVLRWTETTVNGGTLTETVTLKGEE